MLEVFNSAASYPLVLSSGQRYMLQIRNTNNTVNSGYGWWLATDTNFNFALHADGAADRFTLTRTGDATFTGDLTVSGGDIILGAALLSNQENTDVDSAAAETVAQVAHATYTAAFFDFVIKKELT